MGKGSTLLVGCMIATLFGCAGPGDDEFRRALQDCYKKDRLESARLDEEIGPLLTLKARSTLDEGSDCDSRPEGGAYVTYQLDSDVPPREIVKRFHAAGWVDLPREEPHCGETCIIRVGKRVDGRRIELTVDDHRNGKRMLEASFVD